MKRRLRRIVSWLCVLSLCLSLLPARHGRSMNPECHWKSSTLRSADTNVPMCTMKLVGIWQRQTVLLAPMCMTTPVDM